MEIGIPPSIYPFVPGMSLLLTFSVSGRYISTSGFLKDMHIFPVLEVENGQNGKFKEHLPWG